MIIASIRDGAIILLAVESLVIGALLVVLLIQLWRLTRLLEEEIKPLLDSAQETVSTVRSTTEFVSENVISPVVRVHSFIAGLRGGVQALIRPKRRRQSRGQAMSEANTMPEGPSTEG